MLPFLLPEWIKSSLVGAAGFDTLNGGIGNDSLNGGTGDDSLLAGLGDDTYFVDSPGDSISEAANAGTDEVRAFINFTLPADVENLSLFDGAFVGNGNTLGNTIFGNKAANTLDGGIGADRLTGELGNDSYVVDNIGDVVTETSTVATEIDTVDSSVNYSLAANVENLRLMGTAAINGTGNNLNNTLTGNAANNFLNGGVGADTLTGGDGNDTYAVDSAGDVVTEASTVATQIDTVQSSLSYTLGGNVENLTLIGAAAINGTGNNLNNTLTGNTANNSLNGGVGNDRIAGVGGNDTLSGWIGNDILDGGIGNDSLTGGAGLDQLTGAQGVDRFVFNARTEGIDTITDFSVIDDTLNVSAAGFGGGLTANTAITAAQFRLGAAAADASDRLIYNSSTGGLFFDVDGIGGTGQLQIATLSPNLAMTNADIFAIA